MKSVTALLCLVLATPAYGEDSGGGVIQKVLSLIDELEAQMIKDGEDAQKVYEASSELCEERAKQLQSEVKSGKQNAENLKATIAKETADKEGESTKIEELTGAIATSEDDLKAAKTIRSKEAKDFAANEKELMETVSSLERATTVLEKSSASLLQVKNAKTLAQALNVMVEAASISTADASRLSAFVQTANDNDDSDDDMELDADSTESDAKKGGILDTIQGLLEKAEASLDDARKDESKGINDYQLLKQALEEKVKQANLDLAEAKKALAVADEKKATALGDLDLVTKDLQEDNKDLNLLNHDCMAKASDFELETKARGEELKAMATAKKIIVEATHGSHAALNQEQDDDDTDTSFLQVAKAKTGNSAGFAAVKVVRHLANRIKSKAMTQLASRMAAAARHGEDQEDVFAKIKDLISGMIEKLNKEADSDAAKKGFCDREMGDTKAKKEDKESDVEKLTVKIDEATAASTKLKQDVALIQSELAELASTQAEMDKIRQQEKAVYEEQKTELEKGIAGIKMALKVLRDYYAAAEGGTSGAGSGIISMLEVAESDFTKSLQEVKTTESTAEQEYEDETNELKISKGKKEQAIKYKTKEHKSLDQSVTEMSTDLSGTQDELSAVSEYFDKIKGECVAKPDPYEERKARREEEMSGLKEALDTLGSEALLQMSSSRKTLRGKL
eukprot:gnl/TRDRNA2_/TRDRNA2_180286_c0_seq1.p1 gnl/TRDRNA2_/TRDRNA2_180286_c0~~gnl/TRDRNA2_/TRDRNA2_180286_c0_seq1.p1  ORF type:complete len:681 (-),score=257.47 gnl/TRDRNA2_/TRDRNA2_180286_c0_seq1:84-2126(-)